ncbi:hypothetical protein [Thalassotalea profundi]|uniref:Uncharacterized protein n=1 Tax=Thalassotalea profundi TaxID=2036687 RepID=A0ABQ3J7Y5_9GAMM|nr:hypothetical protein [Thalassotalea profundi]GHF01638.1 hypothetical protein GCM10011501_33960 [Thalassotalea profundi]
MADVEKENKNGCLSPLIVMAIVWGALHYLLTGVFFQTADMTCRESSNRYNVAACDCRISKYRSSFLLENYLLGQLGDLGSEKKARQIMYNTMSACPNPK